MKILPRRLEYKMEKTLDCLTYIYIPTVYHLPSGFLSLGKEEPISECLDRRRSLAGLGHGGPTWRVRLSMSLHLVKIWFSLLSSLVHSRGVHSVTLIVRPCL